MIDEIRRMMSRIGALDIWTGTRAVRVRSNWSKSEVEDRRKCGG